MKKVAVMIPSYQHVPVEFFWSALLLFQDASRKYSIGLYGGHTCYLAKTRNHLAQQVLKSDNEYLLWLDADQVYPPETIDVLVGHIDSGKSIIGGLTLKRENKRPLVFHYAKEEGYEQVQAVHVNGMTSCDSMGMGGIMMKADTLRKVGFPYFNEEKYLDGDVRYIADDAYFFRKCKDAGLDVWCDGDLKFGHLVTEII